MTLLTSALMSCQLHFIRLITHRLSQVNGIDLRVATHDECINVLRQTPQCVRLVVFRDEGQYKEEELWDSLSVELQKKPGHGLGLSIIGRRY